MQFHRYIIPIMIFCGLLFSCSSGEYDIDTIEIESVEKTLVYDTLETIRDTVISENSDINPQKRDSYSYVVQIGAFLMPGNFQRFYDEARNRLGNDVYYVQLNNLYKIRIGNFRTKGEALQYLNTVIGQGYPDAFVITVKNPN